MPHILIIEDELELARFLIRLFTLKEYKITHVASGEEFDLIDNYSDFDVALIDVRLPDRNGIELLQTMKTVAPNCPCVIMTGYSTVKLAVDAIKYGAVDFIEKPFEDIERLELLIEQVILNRHDLEIEQYELIAQKLGIFLGTSKEMHAVYKLASKIAPKQINVLIEGETGTGKELLTKFIHAASDRVDGPLVTVNCGALSETLLESELFGHEKGAFTGALYDRAGYFEAASSGTLFLDEIAEATLTTQVKLLRVLESGEYTKIGGTTAEKTEARIIAASHTNLEQAVENGRFREDLRYRLDIVKLLLPPLRERLQDLPFLIEQLIERYNANITFSPEAIAIMQSYSWRGNMRELANTIQHFAAISKEGSLITPSLLPSKFFEKESVQQFDVLPTIHFLDEWQYFSDHIISIYDSSEPVIFEDLLASLKRMEKRTAKAFIEKILKETAGNREQTAKLLGITPRKIRYYLNEV